MVEPVRAIVEDRQESRGVGLAVESNVMLEGEVEIFQSKVCVFAAQFPLDGSILARDPEDCACCSGRNEVISIGAFINGVNVAIGLSVAQSGYDVYRYTHK